MVANKIRDMKDNKPPGVDRIHPTFQLEIVEQISIPLATVFNLYITGGSNSVRMERSKHYIIIYKRFEKQVRNYIPVSLTAVICKL